jgi:hypothetical protein
MSVLMLTIIPLKNFGFLYCKAGAGAGVAGARTATKFLLGAGAVYK